ncbi:MFS transporter [Paenibacillus sp. P25]|nr:MFS transporter [Paenibacillus sp. P25]
MNDAALFPAKQKAGDLFIVLTAGAGLFLSTLDSGIINIALPALAQAFHTSLTVMAWTVTLYSLALTGTIIVFGRLGDRYGRLRIYTLGLVLFSVSSACCGFSQSAGALIAFRGIQGIGAAMLQATATAIITTMVSEDRRGQALGMLAVLMGLGPVLGPSIGGLFLSFGGWPWIFWINIPVAAAGLWGCRFLSGAAVRNHHPVQLDVLGDLSAVFIRALPASGAQLLAFCRTGQCLDLWASHGVCRIVCGIPCKRIVGRLSHCRPRAVP